MAGLAKHIVVDRDDQGAPRITIDGKILPWFTAGIVTPPPSLDEIPTITITIPAEQVTMFNHNGKPELKVILQPGHYRCDHPGCLGRHSSTMERCC